MTTISYDHTEEDTRDWYRFYLTRTPEGRRALRWSRLGNAALFGALVFAIASLLAQPERGEWGYVVASSLAAALVRYVWQIVSFSGDVSDWARKWSKSSKAKRGMAGRISLSATAEGLRFVWPEGESLLRWTAVRKVARTDGHIVVYWSDDEVTLVSRRAFPDEAQMAAFAAQLERHRASAAATATSPAEAIVPLATAASPAPGGAWYQDRQSVDADEATRTRLTH